MASSGASAHPLRLPHQPPCRCSTSQASVATASGNVAHNSNPTLRRALTAGLRWLYSTVQPDTALVERRGAQLTVNPRILRFIPISVCGNPLIVVDLARDIRWGLGQLSPPLNTLPPDELPALLAELNQLDIPTNATGYHGITGTVSLGQPAHPSLVAAVHRFDRGCPYHRSQVCEAPLRDGGQACSWHSDGHRAAIWPDAITEGST